MKFSFQTVFLLFLVTLVHLVVITTFSSLSGNSSNFLAEIDTDKMMENLMSESVDNGVPENPLKIAKDETPETVVEEQDNTEIVPEDSSAEAARDLPAIADARQLGGRVSSPKINSYLSDAPPRVPSPAAQPKKETAAVRAEPVAKKTSGRESLGNEPLASSRLRSIRPIPRS